MANPSPQRGFFRQAIPAVELSLERSTSGVPSDGYFYVVLRGEVQGRFRNKKDALKLYRDLLKKSGYKPEPTKAAPPANLVVERYMDDLQSYWMDSHRHQKRGGKGRY